MDEIEALDNAFDYLEPIFLLDERRPLVSWSTWEFFRKVLS